MSLIIKFLATTIGRVLVSGLGVLALWGAFKFHYEAKGAAKANARTEQANEKVLQRADRVRSKSLNDGVRGVVDPFYID